MSRFKEYLEAINPSTKEKYKLKSKDETAEQKAEDIRRVAMYRREIAHLRASGDDSGIMQEIRSLYDKIRDIEDTYKTPEQLQAREESRLRSSHKQNEKRLKNMKSRQNEAAEKYNQLPLKEKAIEAIVNLRSSRRVLREYYKLDALKLMKEIKQAYDIEESIHEARSNFSLKEKNAIHRSMKGLTNAIPEDLKIMAKTYKLPLSFFV